MMRCCAVVLVVSCGLISALESSPTTPNGPDYCPTFCDEDGTLYKSVYCIFPPYCCAKADILTCCNNATLRITSEVQDLHNCRNSIAWISQYWKIVLGVCLPVALLSLVGFVTLCAVHTRREKRRRAMMQNAAPSRTGSCRSTVSSVSTLSSRTRRCDTDFNAYTDNSNDRPYVVGGEDIPPSAREIFTLEMLASMQPPPYSADKPPAYTDIFPS